MFAVRMILDAWEGVFNRESEIEDPTSEQIRAAIGLLDQRRHTLVVLETEGEAHLLVGGGAGKYVVTATMDGESFLVRVCGPQQASEELITAGGQQGNFPGHQIVGLDVALQAACAFAEHGTLLPEASWESQGG